MKTPAEWATTLRTINAEMEKIGATSWPQADLEDLFRGAMAEAYVAGLTEGITRYAVWRDGVQRVGIMEKPLGEVIEDLDTELLPRELLP